MLAEARHDQPVPPEVVARLDAVLAELGSGVAAEAPATSDEATGEPAVVPLRPREQDSEERRLHRRFSRVLLAAAAVLAIGYGATQVLPNVTQSGSGDSGSASTADSAETPQAPEVAGGDAGARAETPTPVTDLGIAGLRPIDPGALDRDLAMLRRESARSEQFAGNRGTDMVRCGPADPVPGARYVGAAYDGRPALVVYHPVRNGRQTVELYLCDTAHPRKVFRTVTLTP
ncbi:hypothetical protein EKO23_17960 [Nocardioides guangzhouensis]|uniref:Uncharacterized protein n=1 Tax=Nocardioides guangzhouensis TaxID=2497878 RepID=A0A4Q4Z8C2_9ACTN|nr:hypothetical protein [Nocardioides guangzhouensis]RYP83788.1 hypothetical protein EKO23_17960 [Nocardioides guangzhouensis]